MNRLSLVFGCGLAAAAVAACGGRSSLELGVGGAAAGPSASSGVGASGGMPSSCEPRSSWIARAGNEENLESADALVALDDCSVVVTGDVAEGIFVNRYDGAGDLVMSRRFTGDSQLALGVGVDEEGNSYIGAEIWGTVDFGDQQLQSVDKWDMVLLSLAPDGSTRWSRLFGGVDYQQTSDVAVDASGGTLLAGEVAGPIDFGGGTLTPHGSWDIALARFDRDGNHLWSRLVGDEDIQLGPRVAMRPDGSAWWAGWFASTLPLTDQVLVSTSKDDSYLVRLSADGVEEVAVTIGGAGTQRTLDVASVHGGGAVVVGEFSHELVLNSATFTGVGDSDGYVVRYDDGGGEQWARVFTADDHGAARATSVAASADGGVFVVGSFAGSVEVDGTVYPAAGLRDVFVAELNADGTTRRFSTFGDEREQYAAAAGAFPDGSHVFAGSFEGTFVVGEGVDAISAGGTDAFTVRLLPP